jgi:hypothetical protein
MSAVAVLAAHRTDSATGLSRRISSARHRVPIS